MRSVFFRDFTQYILVVCYGLLGRTIDCIFKGQRTGYPVTSVTNCQSTVVKLVAENKSYYIAYSQ